MESSAMPVTMFQTLDSDAFNESMRYADFGACQLSRSDDLSHFAQLSCSNVTLNFAQFGPAMAFTGAMRPDSFTLVFVMECPSEGRVFNLGITHQTEYMAFFPPGSEVDSYTPEGYSNATLTLPEAFFYQALERHFPNIPDRLLQRGAAIPIDLTNRKLIRYVLSQIMDGIKGRLGQGESLQGSPPCHLMEETLLEVFLDALRDGCNSLIPTPTPRTMGRFQRLRQGVDFIKDHETNTPATLDELCNELDMSRRGVEKLFRHSLGVTPIAYIRHQRLHGVRRALREAMPQSGAVKYLALDWGFWHMGNFAKEYHKLFGELPKDTLASNKPVN